MIVTYSTAEGRQVRLADANPAILTFPKTTLGEFEEIRRAALTPREPEPEPEPAEPTLPEVPPNLGPPPPRLDWRKRP